jgi:YjjG family noncanonical pyrimidine nucleotidase
VADLVAALQLYQQVNRELWQQYERHEIELVELQVRRFMPWAATASSAKQLNRQFLLAIAQYSRPLPGAKTLLKTLKQIPDLKIALVSNGFSFMHQHRLRRTGFFKYFDAVVTSEEAGVAKPAPKIFQLSLSKLDVSAKARVLMVGDNLQTDIAGAIRQGFDSCWLRTNAVEDVVDIVPTYQVGTLAELSSLLQTWA